MHTSPPRFYSPPEGFVRLRAALQWDGGAFVGWQSQAQGRSVQDDVHVALSRVCVCERPVAAGRTDAGVHALAMPVHVDVRDGSLKVPPDRLPLALNALLARDVAVLHVEVAPRGFHARFSATSRSYVYRLLPSRVRSPLHEGRALLVRPDLDVPAMRAAAASLVGRHDFAAFATREERQTTRDLLSLDVRRNGEWLEVHVTGESFLRHMIRGLVGTLLLVGEGKLGVDDVRTVLRSADRRLAGPNVAPHGLYFVGAAYD